MGGILLLHNNCETKTTKKILKNAYKVLLF